MPSNGTWVDFRELRQRLDFAAVLRHYGVELRVRPSGRHQGFCPLPGHTGRRRRSPSFSANLERRAFRCFSCNAGGSVIDFAVLMEGKDPGRPQDVRAVALQLHERFVGGTASTDAEPVPKPPAKSAKPQAREESTQENAGQAATCPAIVNAPLDFELQGLDQSHPYLKERGFTAETIAHFGLGYCARGLMQGRIAIPLHDRRGRLVGYAGRLVDDSRVGRDRPKYLMPPPRVREDRRYAFYKSLLLYNGFQVAGPVDDLIVCEGFASVWWLWQCGFPNAVAVMGSACSDRQAALILRLVRQGGRVWLFPDGDDAGRRCAADALPRLAPYRFVHWVRLGKGEQPTDFNAAELADLLTVAKAPLILKGGVNGHP